MPLIGILGGTFDPVHNGHLHLAQEVIRRLALDQVRLVPLNIPPHRHSPITPAVHRKAMLELAIADTTNLCVDPRELERGGMSYTIDTVISLRDEFSEAALLLIAGMDTFNTIDGWRDWQRLLDYIHIVVARRPGNPEPMTSGPLQNWIESNRTDDADVLKKTRHGALYFIDSPMPDISSTLIRKACANNASIKDGLPPRVLTYIKEHQLYRETA